MSASPVFTVTPRMAGVNSGGSTNSTKTLAGADNTVVVIAGAANGSVIRRVSVVQNGTGASTNLNIVRFYIYDGTSYYLVHEKSLGGAVTPSGTVIGIREEIVELIGRLLPSALYQLKVGFSAAAAGDTFCVTAEVEDL